MFWAPPITSQRTLSVLQETVRLTSAIYPHLTVRLDLLPLLLTVIAADAESALAAPVHLIVAQRRRLIEGRGRHTRAP